MDPILIFMILYIIVQIILIWPMPNVWMKIILLVFLLVLVLLGFFGGGYLLHSGLPTRTR